MSQYNSQQVRKSAMKSIITLAAGVSLLATAAVAQEQVEVSGTAPAICSLPSTWTVAQGAGGAGASQFDAAARVWTVPTNLVTNAAGMVTTGDTGIRLRGAGYCNTSHTISITTQNGGMRADSEAPEGFSNIRRMRYDAHWSSGTQTVYGGNARGVVNWRPTAAGTNSATFTVTSTAMPGQRDFDVRLGLSTTGGSGLPLIQGAYEDVITVSLAILP
jgi:hypothetical protein